MSIINLNRIKNRAHLMRRGIHHFGQYLRWGFSDKATWSLDYTIAKFALPRLRRFQKVRAGYPGGLKGGSKKWKHILKEIEWYLETVVVFGDTGKDVGEKDMKRYKKAQKYWGKYFGNLWW